MEGTPGFNKLVLDLLAEKDRLIGEKDELVESKNKLWREAHGVVREKNREIEELRQEVRDVRAENARVKGKAIELEAALRELLDEESDSAEEIDGQQSKSASGARSVDENHQGFTLTQNAQRDNASPSRRFADTRLSPASSSAADAGNGTLVVANTAGTSRRSLNTGPRLGSQAAVPQHAKAATAESSGLTRLRSHAKTPSAFPADASPSAQASSPDGTVPNRYKSYGQSSSSYRPTPAQSSKPNITEHEALFTFAPLKQVNNGGGGEVGQMVELAPSVIESIRSTMSEIAKRHKQGQSAAHPSPQLHHPCCAWLWMLEKGYTIRWTLTAPQRYACFSCFNARRACLLWLGKMKWMVLPIPPQTRGHQVTWKDAGFYIYEGRMTTSVFAHIWEEGRNTRKRKRADIED